MSDFEVIQKGPPPARYVLFVRSGSDIPLILQNYSSLDDITIVVSLYDLPAYELSANWWVIKGGRSKFESAQQFLENQPEFFTASLLAFFDPDIAIEWKNLLLLFKKGDIVKCSVYQACLSEQSYGSWSFLYKSNRCVEYRKVSFVEVMAPVFKSSFLKKVYNQFTDSVSTWGLEYIWYSKAREPLLVIDSLNITHSSPVDTTAGKFYIYLSRLGVDPWREKNMLRFKYTTRSYKEMELPRLLPWAMNEFFFLFLRILYRF
jgi:hypothetical protein